MWMVRVLALTLTYLLAGCATPGGAPCSNWSVLCGCYCGPGQTWSGAEPEPPGIAFPPRPTKEMSLEDRSSIRMIYVDDSVTLPQLPNVRTRADTWAEGVGGAIAVIRSTDYSKEHATAEYLKKNKIRIDEMLVHSFAAELENRNKFALVTSPSSADAVINFVVTRYGIEHTFNPISNDYRTYLNTSATMVSSGGNVIWRKQCSAESDDQQQTTFNELYGNPEMMRKHMLIVTSICAKKMVDHLVGSQ